MHGLWFLREQRLCCVQNKRGEYTSVRRGHLKGEPFEQLNIGHLVRMFDISRDPEKLTPIIIFRPEDTSFTRLEVGNAKPSRLTTQQINNHCTTTTTTTFVINMTCTL